ncbi:hypothetical protein NKI79_31575 [Mesorhizobium sp. M0340]|uniref:hypothetical protein n=1 Tax=Mesorhizobium sp. M0340 TaxID=2956939 RepID=UPI00333CB44E
MIEAAKGFRKRNVGCRDLVAPILGGDCLRKVADIQQPITPLLWGGCERWRSTGSDPVERGDSPRDGSRCVMPEHIGASGRSFVDARPLTRESDNVETLELDSG